MADRNPLPPEVVDALKRGQKIEAIKLLRQAMAVGLAEAKSVVEAHERMSGDSAPRAGAAAKSAAVKSKAANHTSAYIRARADDLSPGEVPRSSASPLGIVVAIAAVAAAAWLYVEFG